MYIFFSLSIKAVKYTRELAGFAEKKRERAEKRRSN
jgi:hypothetical protein